MLCKCYINHTVTSKNFLQQFLFPDFARTNVIFAHVFLLVLKRSPMFWPSSFGHLSLKKKKKQPLELRPRAVWIFLLGNLPGVSDVQPQRIALTLLKVSSCPSEHDPSGIILFELTSLPRRSVIAGWAAWKGNDEEGLQSSNSVLQSPSQAIQSTGKHRTKGPFAFDLKEQCPVSCLSEATQLWRQ